MSINTHNLIVDFGKHKGERWTRLPLSYLKWLINENTQWKNIAISEMERRGTSMDDMKNLEISGHAIDRASIFCAKIWKQTRKREEGIHAWLFRMATLALTDGKTSGADADVRHYIGIKWVFSFGEIYPTLKTVMTENNHRRQ